MDIRGARASDVGAIVDLWAASGLTRPWNDAREDAVRALEGPASTVLLGEDEGRLVATVMVGHDGHRGWVYYLAVREDARRRGHGAAMMRAAEDWLRERRVPKLQLMVRDENRDVIGFYEALGYELNAVRVLSRRL